MSWPSKEDLDALLQSAQGQPEYTIMAIRADYLVYLIENLDRLTGEIATLADRIEATRKEAEKQKQRAKKWKRKYTALENKQHEEVRQDPHDRGGQDGAEA